MQKGSRASLKFHPPFCPMSAEDDLQQSRPLRPSCLWRSMFASRLHSSRCTAGESCRLNGFTSNGCSLNGLRTDESMRHTRTETRTITATDRRSGGREASTQVTYGNHSFCIWSVSCILISAGSTQTARPSPPSVRSARTVHSRVKFLLLKDSVLLTFVHVHVPSQ